MRQHKERLALKSCDVQIPAQYYQYYLEKALLGLSQIERRAIYFRFIKPRTIAQVATRLKLSWEETDALIDRSLKKVHASFKESLLSQSSSVA